MLADREELLGQGLGQLAGLGANQRGVEAVAGKGAEGREGGEDVGFFVEPLDEVLRLEDLGGLLFLGIHEGKGRGMRWIRERGRPPSGA